MMKRMRLLVSLSLMLLSIGGIASVVRGNAAPQTGSSAADLTPAARLARLEAGVRRAEGIRAAKRLQHAYAHFVEYGLWQDAADLFAEKGTAWFGTTAVTGREAIRARMLAGNGGRIGLAEGRLNSRLVLEPVVTLDPDGTVVRGRWHVFGMVGQHGESAAWEGGIFENEYVEENGVWKIHTLREYPQFTGQYEDAGWRETPDAAPFHYDVTRAGVPVPPVHQATSSSSPDARQMENRLASVALRLRRLEDEAAVLNLQHSYGYYVDRKMWDDVVDLFAKDGTLEVDNRGIYAGAASIRRLLDTAGPQGLKNGEIHDHLQLQTFVTVADDGRTAKARGLELRMLGVNNQYAEWGQAIFENTYVKQDGVWKIQSMQIAPKLVVPYETGWTGSKPLVVKGSATPDRPASRTWALYPKIDYVPFHFANPATGRPVQYPSGVQAAPAPPAGGPAVPAAAPKIEDLERSLARVIAYDGTENVSNAYGYYIDGFLWDDMADLFSRDGWKELSYIGTYVGRERVRASVKMRYGNRNGRTRATGGFAMHQKTQPVITVADDGQSTRIRTRLFQLGGTTWLTGIYENGAVNEDGVWKISAMDLDYVWTAQDAAGWAKVADSDNRRFAPAAPPAVPPDRPLRGVQYAPYPKVADMGFHYRNPVSGRAPALLLD